MASGGQYGGWRGRGKGTGSGIGTGKGRGRGSGWGTGRGSGSWRQNERRGAQSLNDLSADFSPGRESVDRNWRQRQHEHEMFYSERQGKNHEDSQKAFYGGRRGGRNENRKRNLEQCEISGNFYTTEVRCQNNKRQYPIGRKQLEQLMEMHADVIVLELLREQSGYQVFLQEDNVHSENLLLLLTVLSRACSSKSNKENLNELFDMTCKQKFLDKLCAFTMTVKRNYPGRASSFFHDLHIFLETYANAMITNAMERITDLVDACISVLTFLQLKGIVAQDLIKKYESLQNLLEECKEKWNRSRNVGKYDRRGQVMDEMEPPNDFRELPVVPVPYDLSTMERPFLRRNIVEGKYQDEEHYLDVQFRLLREDFVRPLRNGIHDFRAGNRKVRDVRIYRDVEIIGSDIKRKKMIHLIQLNLPKKFKMENSKRLLYGNLLCFTNNNFNTMFLASVAERDGELAKNGIIGVTLESDITDFDLSGKFLMVESRAYFMAYKHVLQSLKDISGTGVPMAPYIIHVNSKVKPPNYLKVDTHYNLQVVKEEKMMKMSEAHNKLFKKLHSEDFITVDDRYPELSRIPMFHGLETWPSTLELGLDKSQHRALHGALTHELAIIQGPPGTGKTFIGLKITQILLHNSEVWKDTNHPTPILVVCFTNHALDQFLEGMTAYTESIVRVGSRSRNEAMNKFQVNNLVRYLHGSRRIPNMIHDRNRILYNDIQDIENKVRNLRAIVHCCKYPQGVLSLHTFLQEFIIPEHLGQQLIKGNQQMINWLLFNMECSNVDNSMKKLLSQNEINCSSDSRNGSNQEIIKSGQLSEKDNENLSDEDSDDRDILEDAEELLQQEEVNRRLDEEDDQDVVDNPVILSYEITFHELDEEMKKLYNKDNDQEEYFSYTILAAQKKALAIGLNLEEKPLEMENLEKMNINLWNLDFPTRWTLYKHWLSKLHEKITKKLIKQEGDYQRKSDALQEIKQQEYLYIMRHASIVGMTTTGAAQYNSVMQDLAPAIVIIEEAAEILESHVMTSLTSSCQHLILIGDHQQLRPSATVFELATKYGLETSLFERMIKNGLSYDCLEYQHRMRPSISKLLVPTIYPHLKDDTSVTKYPHIKGIDKDLFFISHQIHEKEEADDNNSHENFHEAQFTIALCRHLMLQGYDANDVTILTPYSGQFFLLKKLQREHSVCSGVRICVVDNFQGEENKIILLSLVRSNVDGKVGFLRTDNRVCVALSRAKEGLYITGNMDLLCASSKLWQDIKKDLEAEGNIDSALPLRCENHHVIQRVTTGEEFFTKSPEGGCLHLCNKSLPRCDHLCPKVCHMDDLDHKMYKCREPCPKVLCNLDHPCPKLCWEDCQPCQIKVQKTLPCSHVHNIPCYIDPEKYRCPTQVKRVLPDCQHEATMPCHAKPERWTCPMDCDTRLDCGHMCRQKCHVREDPEHRKYDCLQSCTRLNAGCTQNHPCQKKCYEDCGSCVKEVSKVLPCGHTANNVQCHIAPENVQCKEKCKRTLGCGHACKNMCYKPCGNCPVKVKKIVPSCQHTVLIECGEEPTADKCDGACPKILSCGHPCLERCYQTCTSKCPAKVTSDAKCPKNHTLLIPCYQEGTAIGEDTWMHCNKPCGQILDCGHKCQGKCGHCFQGRVHEACKKPCNKSLVCGHICKHPCGANCPPCQEKCEWQCKHSKCKKACGIPCIPCKEKCQRECKHGKCENFCGSKCSRDPCDKPCEKKLKCDHPCVGFCGEPCPPLCRTCDTEELTEFTLLGFEDDDDARFVLLEDCGHCIEVQGLEGWLSQNEAEIGMKTCPRCRKPIYNSSRYKNIVLETYKTVKAVKTKYYSRRTLTKRKEVEVILQGLIVDRSNDYFKPQIQQLQKKLDMGPSKKKHKQKPLNESELQLSYFQAVVLKRAREILLKCDVFMGSSHFVQLVGTKKNKSLEKLKPMVELLVDRVMQRTQIIPPQMVEEISCELQRLTILPSYWNLLERNGSISNNSLSEIVAKLEKIMDPTIKYDSVTEKKVAELLEESKKYVAGLGISNSERIMIVQAMGLKQGHWYKCPNGHVYCITECGGARQKSSCPDCKASIGGEAYRLADGNAVASEMDGATRAAWS